MDHHLQPLVQAVKSYTKDTNDFLKNLPSLLKLPDVSFLGTIDVKGPHDEGLSALRKQLEIQKEKYVSTETTIT